LFDFSNIEGSDIDNAVMSGGVMVNNELERIWKEAFMIFLSYSLHVSWAKAPI